MSKLIDRSNIDLFIKEGGKFLYTDGNIGLYKKYLHNHLVNSIYFPALTLRASNSYNFDNHKSAGILPVQQIDIKSVARILNNVGLSKHDKICVYGGSDDLITDCLYVLYTLSKFGLDLYYLNMNWETLPAAYITQKIPVYKKIHEKYEYADYNISARKTFKLGFHRKTKIIDVRPNNFYKGDDKTFPINGHIPHSINIFWKTLMVPSTEPGVIASQTFNNESYIKNLLNSNGITKEDNIIVYCNSGSELCAMYFAIKNILGWKKMKIFEGSWTVYQYLSGEYPDKYPVAVGPLP